MWIKSTSRWMSNKISDNSSTVWEPSVTAWSSTCFACFKFIPLHLPFKKPLPSCGKWLRLTFLPSLPYAGIDPDQVQRVLKCHFNLSLSPKAPLVILYSCFRFRQLFDSIVSYTAGAANHRRCIPPKLLFDNSGSRPHFGSQQQVSEGSGNQYGQHDAFEPNDNQLGNAHRDLRGQNDGYDSGEE